MSLMDYISKLFDSKFINWDSTEKMNRAHLIAFSLLIFSVSIVFYYLTRFIIKPDDVNYMRYAGYIVNSNGFIPENSITDFAKMFNAPIVGYPWGSALTIAFFNFIGLDILFSYVIVKAFTVTFFFVVIIKILESINSTNFVKYSYSILSIPILNIFYYNYVSDSLSLLFYFLGIVITLILIKKQKIDFYYIPLYSFLLFLPAFFRYAYYPLIYIIPLILFVQSVKESDKRKIITVISISIFLAIFIALNMLFEQTKTGRMLFLNQNYGYTHESLYWENLLLLDGFALKVFFDYSKIIDLIGLQSFSPLFFVISSTILGLVIWYSLAKIKTLNNSYKIYSFIGILFLTLNTLLLLILSLKEAPQPINGFWTYAKETRYYAVSMVFILTICLIAITDGELKKIFRTTIYLLLSMSFLYSFLLLGKDLYSSYNKPEYITRKEVYKVVKKIADKQPNKHLIFSSESKQLCNLISAYGPVRLVSKPNNKSQESNLYDSLIKKDTLYASSAVILIVHLKDNDESRLFQSKFKPIETFKINDGVVCTLEIDGYRHATKTPSLLL